MFVTPVRKAGRTIILQFFLVFLEHAIMGECQRGKNCPSFKLKRKYFTTLSLTYLTLHRIIVYDSSFPLVLSNFAWQTSNELKGQSFTLEMNFGSIIFNLRFPLLKSYKKRMSRCLEHYLIKWDDSKNSKILSFFLTFWTITRINKM